MSHHPVVGVFVGRNKGSSGYIFNVLYALVDTYKGTHINHFIGLTAYAISTPLYIYHIYPIDILNKIRLKRFDLSKNKNDIWRSGAKFFGSLTNKLCFLSVMFLSVHAFALNDTDMDSLPDGWELLNDRDPLTPDYQISLGAASGCILDDDGVSCWGYMHEEVPSLSNPKMLAGDDGLYCAIDDFESHVGGTRLLKFQNFLTRSK